jgi:hypothetical protein
MRRVVPFIVRPRLEQRPYRRRAARAPLEILARLRVGVRGRPDIVVAWTGRGPACLRRALV